MTKVFLGMLLVLLTGCTSFTLDNKDTKEFEGYYVTFKGVLPHNHVSYTRQLRR